MTHKNTHTIVYIKAPIEQTHTHTHTHTHTCYKQFCRSEFSVCWSLHQVTQKQADTQYWVVVPALLLQVLHNKAPVSSIHYHTAEKHGGWLDLVVTTSSEVSLTGHSEPYFICFRGVKQRLKKHVCMVRSPFSQTCF